MSLRASEHALTDLQAWIELRIADLQAQLDIVQAEISDLVRMPDGPIDPVRGWFDMDDYRTLANLERAIIAQIERY